VDQIIVVLLKTNMAIGGLTAAILDNVLPGNNEDRGLNALRNLEESDGGECCSTYDLPYIQNFLNRNRWVRFIPFLPYHPIMREGHPEGLHLNTVA